MTNQNAENLYNIVNNLYANAVNGGDHIVKLSITDTDYELVISVNKCGGGKKKGTKKPTKKTKPAKKVTTKVV